MSVNDYNYDVVIFGSFHACMIFANRWVVFASCHCVSLHHFTQLSTSKMVIALKLNDVTMYSDKFYFAEHTARRFKHNSQSH
jgi:hypothetical protein